MKRIHLLLLLLFPLIACEDVVDVDLDASRPRLVIDALIKIDQSQPNVTVRIISQVSSSFFDEPQPATLDQITLTNLKSNGLIILFETEPGSGIYENDPLAPVPISFLTDGRILLQINYNQEIFLAYAEYVPAVPIESLTQGDADLFGDNDTEIKIKLIDDADRNDFYLFDFNGKEYFTSRDTFYQGQEFEFSYFLEDLNPGDEVKVSILGMNQEFYNYMNQIISQSGQDSFGPFDTPVAAVRGNIINATEIDNIDYFDNTNQTDNYALGYFAISETFTSTLIIE